jgi:hypothetical protein
VNLFEFLTRATGWPFAVAIVALTACYSGLFINALYELVRFYSLPADRWERRRFGRSLIRLFTASSDVVKLAVVGGFALTLIGFIQVIEGFRTFDKNVALGGMSLAVVSSMCYVPVVIVSTLWLWALRAATAVRPELKEHFWGDRSSA